MDTFAKQNIAQLKQDFQLLAQISWQSPLTGPQRAAEQAAVQRLGVFFAAVEKEAKSDGAGE